MICGVTKREAGGEDRSLEAFQDLRVKLVVREARAAGFVTRAVPDGDTEYLDIFARDSAAADAGGEARAFAKLANRLRSCGLGHLTYEVDSDDEQEDLLAELSAEAAPPEWSIPVRGDGFARELDEEERSEIEALRAGTETGAGPAPSGAPVSGVEGAADADGGRARIFVGVPDAGSLGDAPRVAPLLTVFRVGYPMELDEEDADGRRVARIEDEGDLAAWAGRNFGDWDIR